MVVVSAAATLLPTTVLATTLDVFFDCVKSIAVAELDGNADELMLGLLATRLLFVAVEELELVGFTFVTDDDDAPSNLEWKLAATLLPPAAVVVLTVDCCVFGGLGTELSHSIRFTFSTFGDGEAADVAVAAGDDDATVAKCEVVDNGNPATAIAAAFEGIAPDATADVLGCWHIRWAKDVRRLAPGGIIPPAKLVANRATDCGFWLPTAACIDAVDEARGCE